MYLLYLLMSICSLGACARIVDEEQTDRNVIIDTDGNVLIDGDLTVSGSLFAANLATNYVTGPATAQDTAIARFDGTTGLVIQSSALKITDLSSGTQTMVALKADDGMSANIDMVVAPHGTGAFTLQIPDGTPLGGTARGTNAVDLQMSRQINSHVAAAAYSALIAGSNNVIATTGTNAAVIAGTNNGAGNSNAIVAGGSSNQAMGTNAGIFAGNDNKVGGSAGNNAVIIGGANNLNISPAAAIIGGINNEITGATANNAIIAGGSGNRAEGANSFAAGNGAYATSAGSFVWADTTGGSFTDQGADTFNVRATNGAFFSNNVTFNNSGTSCNVVGSQAQAGVHIIQGVFNLLEAYSGAGFSYTPDAVPGIGAITLANSFTTNPALFASSDVAGCAVTLIQKDPTTITVFATPANASNISFLAIGI